MKMGDIAEMMLDGTLCQCCGEYMGESMGFATTCAACRRDTNINSKYIPRSMRPSPKNTSCPVCKRRVRIAGLDDHMKALHTVKAELPAILKEQVTI
jgi:hypothetical protein